MTAAIQHTATADQLREQADEMDLIAGVIFDASSLHDAAARLRAVADAKRTAAGLLDEMATEAAPPAHCVCCTYDCGDRRGHVLDDRQFVTPQRCVCGDYWPCERPS